MREQARDIERLWHIDECIGHIMDFLEEKTFEEMKSDVMCFHAVVYNIMIIGEAANMLTKEFREGHPETPWRDIIDMRNVLVHDYIHISKDMLWVTITQDVPELKIHVERYYKEFE